MSGMRCYYEVLELERDCSAEEVRALSGASLFTLFTYMLQHTL